MSASSFALAFFELLLVGFLSWRAALPNSRHQGGLDYLVVETDHVDHFLPRDTHIYDDVLTQVAARNFARDGFLRTHGLPNRRGAPRVSLYDFTQTQCEPLGATAHPLVQWNGFGQRVENISANGDCVHIHYPPLADWLFGGLASLGLDRVLYYKALSILLNAGFLLLFYRWLCREVRRLAALAATLFAGTFPAFLTWADALYFHPFQLLFLIAGILCWSSYLERLPRVARPGAPAGEIQGQPHAATTSPTPWFVATWLLFFCESLVSYQLTLFFAIALAGLLLLEARVGGFAAHTRRLCLQATAPVMALGLQLALSISLFGLGRVIGNLTKTVSDRVAQGPPGGFGQLASSVNRTLVHWAIAVIALLVIIVARTVRRAPLKRPVAILGIFFVGGLSFMGAFPGHAKWHGESLHRLLLPFVGVLLAFVVDAIVSLFGALKESLLAQRRGAPARLAQAVPALCTVLGLLVLGWVLRSNAEHVRGEVGWALVKNRHPDPDNRVLGSLDTIYWTEGVPSYQGILLMPVSGVRVGEPPAWSTDFRIVGPAASHYEIWWLDALDFKMVRLLVDQQEATRAAESCFIRFFEDGAFQRPHDEPLVTRADFAPAQGEPSPPKPYAWVQFSLAEALRSRALRLSCTGVDTLTLRQIEAFDAEGSLRDGAMSSPDPRTGTESP